MDWSKDGQSPEFLAATRMATLSPRVVDQILQNVPLQPGMRVLDVGCGSGEYAFRLGMQVEGVTFVGLEYDPEFVHVANLRAQGQLEGPYEPVNGANSYVFVQGDGLSLPFEDGMFDAVVSHTYLTAIPDYVAALAEMCRVCKPGGMVSSVTVLGDDFGGIGRVKLMPWMLDPSIAPLVNKVENLVARYDSGMNLTAGIPPKKVPVTFAWIGLEGVSVTPLGQYFCLSDAKTQPWEYQAYVDLLHAMELRKIEWLGEIPVEDGGLTSQEWAGYRNVIDDRREQLLQMQGRNPEWDWFASAALLVSGRVPECGMSEVAEVFKDETEPSRRLREVAYAAGLAFDEDYCQLGPGRCCRVTLRTPQGRQIVKYGFTPSFALEEGILELLSASGVDEANFGQVVSTEISIEESCREAVDVAKGLLVHDGLMQMPPEKSFYLPGVWESASEAVQLGYAVKFFDGGTCKGLPVVVCELSKDGSACRALAAHPEVAVAVKRSFARACAVLDQ